MLMMNDDIQGRLFTPDRVQRRELWSHVKLVAPSNEKKTWRTRDAVAAYCLLCKEKITYKAGTSVQIQRHIKNCHPEEYEKYTPRERSKKIKISDEQVSSSIGTKRGRSSSGDALLLKMIIENNLPPSIVENEHFLIFIDHIRSREKYQTPTTSDINEMIRTTSQSNEAYVHNMVYHHCHFYSVFCKLISSEDGSMMYSIQIRFVDENFNFRSPTLQVVRVEANSASVSELRDITMKVLEDNSLAASNSVVILECTTPGSEAQDEPEWTCFDIREILHRSMPHSEEFLRDHGKKLRSRLRMVVDTAQVLRTWALFCLDNDDWLSSVVDVSNETYSALDKIVHSVSFFGMLQPAAKMRNLFSANVDGIPNAPSPVSSDEWGLVDGVLELTKYFDSFCQELAIDSHVSHSNLIPALRTLHRNVEHFRSSHGSTKVIEAIQGIQNLLAPALVSIQNRMEANFLWTTILNPRFVRMQSLSEDERESAKRRLIQEMKSSKEIQSNGRQIDTHAMLGEIESYLSALGNTNVSEDIYAWWQSKHTQFPHVARLARKYLSAVLTSDVNANSMLETLNQFDVSFRENQKMVLLRENHVIL